MRSTHIPPNVNSYENVRQ